jgi:hypothetical protein
MVRLEYCCLGKARVGLKLNGDLPFSGKPGGGFLYRLLEQFGSVVGNKKLFGNQTDFYDL